MGMGIPTGLAFPWESHRNGNSFWATDGNGNGLFAFIFTLNVTLQSVQ